MLVDLVLPEFGSLSDTAAYAEMVVSTKYQVVAGAYMLGVIVYLFGVFALYAFLAGSTGERWGLFGLVFVVLYLLRLRDEFAKPALALGLPDRR